MAEWGFIWRRVCRGGGLEDIGEGWNENVFYFVRGMNNRVRILQGV